MCLEVLLGCRLAPLRLGSLGTLIPTGWKKVVSNVFEEGRCVSVFPLVIIFVPLCSKSFVEALKKVVVSILVHLLLRSSVEALQKVFAVLLVSIPVVLS